MYLLLLQLLVQEHQDQHLELDILQVGVVVLNIEIKVLQVLAAEVRSARMAITHL